MPKEYVFFCDESDRRGKFFSNFYGGVRISSADLIAVNDRLRLQAATLGLNTEIKWQKTDSLNYDRYQKMMDTFFDEIAAGRVVVRIMFTQNIHIPIGLTKTQQDEEYFILYYQFLKHAFGLASMPDQGFAPKLRIYLDELGDTKEKVAKFRGYVGGLSNIKTTSPWGFTLAEQDITEVRSHDHILMQCLDVVLGAMSFRLNDKHKEIPAGQKKRGKRTVAKEHLYRHIFRLITKVTAKTAFNIGISTGTDGRKEASWEAPYLHWRFVPRLNRYDKSRGKP